MTRNLPWNSTSLNFITTYKSRNVVVVSRYWNNIKEALTKASILVTLVSNQLMFHGMHPFSLQNKFLSLWDVFLCDFSNVMVLQPMSSRCSIFRDNYLTILSNVHYLVIVKLHVSWYLHKSYIIHVHECGKVSMSILPAHQPNHN